MNQNTVPFQWNPLGLRSSITSSTIPNILTISTPGLTGKLGVSHLMVGKAGNLYYLRQKMYGSHLALLTNEVNWFNETEFRTIFDLPREASATSEDFTKSIGADYAIPEKFSRKGDQVNILLGVYPMSIFLTKAIKDKTEALAQYKV